MARRGRKPKPTAIKELEGNPGKRPLNKNEPKPENTAPKCPTWLDKEAKKEWRRMSKALEAIGILTKVDGAAFAGYCQAYARWKEAEEFLSKHGTIFKTPSGYIQQVPQVSIAQAYLKIMKDFCSEFGLTPASRTRLHVGLEGENQEGDEMEMLLLNVPKGEDLINDS
jgi:P27 family predicted phage terminase small subunit